MARSWSSCFLASSSALFLKRRQAVSLIVQPLAFLDEFGVLRRISYVLLAERCYCLIVGLTDAVSLGPPGAVAQFGPNFLEPIASGAPRPAATARRPTARPSPVFR